MKKINIILIIGIIFMTASCGKEFQPREIEFVEIAKGALAGNGEEGIAQGNVVITSATDWQNLVTKMNSFNTNAIDDNIQINFNDSIALTVFLEVKDSGWEVEISKIIENENDIIVTISEKMYDNSVMAQPFYIVKIPKTDKEVRFTFE